jgi:hypothetical protein
MSVSRSIPLLLTLLAASCASDSGSNQSPAPEPPKPLSQRLSESNGYQQDSNGNWVPKIDKRSSFESQGDSHNFKGEYSSGKTYKAGEYAKKSWWGNKDYGRQSYAGDTDGSRFQQKSRFDGKGARETTGDTAKIAGQYQTGTYATSTARESGKDDLTKPSDAETDSRRRVYQEPEIIDWKQQRAITLDQSKGILGR